MTDNKDLRQKAEKRVQEKAPLENIDTLSPAKVKKMLHELQVHQIELEMQNEELRKAQESLDASRARYFDLYDLAPVGYITLSEQGLILESNLAAATLLGESRSNLVRRPLSGFIFKEDQDIYYRHRKLLFESGEPQEWELRMVKKDGLPFWAHLAATAAQYDGGTVCRIVMSDITERKLAEAEQEKLQAQLNQARKMESIGTLAGGVAHDFNNMLGVILGYTELAMNQVDSGLPLHADLEEIHKAARRSADLTRQLLAFARKQVVTPRVLDLNDIVPGMIKMLQRLIGENIDIVWISGENLWPVQMDPSQIDQILANLCINAKDAIAGVGKITLKTGNCVLEEPWCAVHPDFMPGNHARQPCPAHRERHRLRHGQRNACPSV